LPPCPVGAVSNRTASARPDKSGSRPVGRNSAYHAGEQGEMAQLETAPTTLFLGFTIVNVSRILFPYQDFRIYEVACFKVLAVSNELIHSCSAV
jgi:hypothetical protein